MSKSKYKDFLINKITKEQVDPKEAKKLENVIDFVKLNTKNLRSGRTLSTVQAPGNKFTKLPVLNVLKKTQPKVSLLKKSSSLEDLNSVKQIPVGPVKIQLPTSILSKNTIQILRMTAFSSADFNRMIPEFKGDCHSLPVFLKRCDTFHSTLDADGQISFLNHIIFKLGGKAFIIFESKKYTTWPALKKDLLEGIKVNKSTSALQNELMALVQEPHKSAKEFADMIKEKLKELSDILVTQYSVDEVIKSFKQEYSNV